MSFGTTVVDYGSGNLLSVQRALEHVGAVVARAQTPEAILSAERLVLPGVGAFPDGIDGLRTAGLTDPIIEFARSGRPLLGICLGMQMLATVSEEFGVHLGLDLIPGRVVAMPTTTSNGFALKRPHIGWADLHLAPGRSLRTSEGILDGDAVYLVHSFHFEPERDADRLACCIYGGHEVTAAVQFENILGFQFHPEKSGTTGLRILSAFLNR